MSAESKNKCFLCGRDVEKDCPSGHPHVSRYVCDYCGTYLLDDFIKAVRPLTNEEKLKIACALNERKLKGLGGVALGLKTEKKKSVCNCSIISIDELLGQCLPENSDS
ncbi:MAG TPA: hypothetical protein ENH34_04355 [Phycisphaerales bacterium]|nr:hypothetical protein [Phycisphaerales bacterium]